MEVNIPAGCNITEAAQLAIKEAQEVNRAVFFFFNGVKIFAHPKSYEGDLAEIYLYKRKLSCGDS